MYYIYNHILIAYAIILIISLSLFGVLTSVDYSDPYLIKYFIYSLTLNKLHADGIMTSNNLLMQLQADLSGIPVCK